MNEIIENSRLVKIKEQVNQLIEESKRINEIFLKKNVYPELNMDDIITTLKEQKESIDKILELPTLDYNELYNTENNESILATEELILNEQQLIDDVDEMEKLYLDEMEEMCDNYMKIITDFTHLVFENGAEERVNDFLNEVGVTELDLLDEPDPVIDYLDQIRE